MKNFDLIQVDLNVIRDLTKSLLDDEKFRSFSHDRFSAQLQTIVDKVNRIETYLSQKDPVSDPRVFGNGMLAETQEVKSETGVDPETQKILDAMK